MAAEYLPAWSAIAQIAQTVRQIEGEACGIYSKVAVQFSSKIDILKMLRGLYFITEES
jgi:hypothetical protein